jgi:hypothetical protein
MYILCGRATHYRAGISNACGTSSQEFTEDINKVNCLRCFKTKEFKKKLKELKSEAK